MSNLRKNMSLDDASTLRFFAFGPWNMGNLRKIMFSGDALNLGFSFLYHETWKFWQAKGPQCVLLYRAFVLRTSLMYFCAAEKQLASLWLANYMLRTPRGQFLTIHSVRGAVPTKPLGIFVLGAALLFLLLHTVPSLSLNGSLEEKESQLINVIPSEKKWNRRSLGEAKSNPSIPSQVETSKSHEVAKHDIGSCWRRTLNDAHSGSEAKEWGRRHQKSTLLWVKIYRDSGGRAWARTRIIKSISPSNVRAQSHTFQER